MSNVSSPTTDVTHENLIKRFKAAQDDLDKASRNLQDARAATVKIEATFRASYTEYMAATVALAKSAAGTLAAPSTSKNGKPIEATAEALAVPSFAETLK
jgi:acyl-CoA reductase-like NAD-dependent aldehyde dehydrogenase